MSAEQEKNPSNLRLFRCYGQLQAPIEWVYNRTLEFQRQFQCTNQAFDRLVQNSNGRLERILGSLDDVHSQLLSTESMITCGQVYLIFENELSRTGMSGDQIYDFFKICAKLNTGFWDKFIARDKQRELVGKKFIEAAKHDIKNPPLWFDKSLERWAYLVLGYANFVELIDSRINNMNIPSGRKLPSQRVLILSGQYPDWYDINSSQPPDRDEVIAEFEEDFNSLELIDGQHALLHRNIDGIRRVVFDKISKTSIWVYKRLRDFYPDSSTFASSVCVTEVIRMLYESSYSAFYPKQKSDDNPDRPRLRALKKMASTESFEVNPEYLALWFEKVLTGARVGWKLTDPLDQKKIAILNNSVAEKRSAVQSVRYDIVPLMKLLSEEDKQMLSQLAVIYEDERGCLEEYIWLLSEALSPYTTPGIYESRGKDVISLMERVRNFVIRWYIQNSRWAFEKLAEEIGRPKQEIQPSEIQQQFGEKIEEVEVLASEVRYDPLSEWNFIYTPKRIISASDGVLIRGSDRLSIGCKLEKYLREQGITCSVPVSSIVNALDWVVNMPKEIEQIRMGQNIAGEEYKKIKRDRMRIFYRLDRVNNTLYFFLHHKDAWGYRF